jgi:hypothetical protein
MNLFDKAKNTDNSYHCRHCQEKFNPDKRNLNRGWGLFCSRSCAKRFKNKLDNLSESELKAELRDIKISQIFNNKL